MPRGRLLSFATANDTPPCFAGVGHPGIREALNIWDCGAYRLLGILVFVGEASARGVAACE